VRAGRGPRGGGGGGAGGGWGGGRPGAAPGATPAAAGRGAAAGSRHLVLQLPPQLLLRLGPRGHPAPPLVRLVDLRARGVGALGQQRAPRGTPTGRVDCSARGGGAGRFSRSVRGPVGDKSRDGRGEQHPPPPLPSRVTQSRRRGHLQHHLLELLLDQVERVPHVRPHRSAGYLRPGRQPLLGSPHSGASSPRTPGERSLGGRVRAHRKGSTSPPRARSAWGLARICAGSRVGWQLPRAFCARGRAEDPGMPASSRSWVFLERGR